ncbi:uncharacterized protein LOC144451287 [Glandiceps talaboti]
MSIQDTELVAQTLAVITTTCTSDRFTSKSEVIKKASDMIGTATKSLQRFMENNTGSYSNDTAAGKIRNDFLHSSSNMLYVVSDSTVQDIGEVDKIKEPITTLFDAINTCLDITVMAADIGDDLAMYKDEWIVAMADRRSRSDLHGSKLTSEFGGFTLPFGSENDNEIEIMTVKLNGGHMYHKMFGSPTLES